MAATTINLPLYRVLTDLNVPEERAREAAEASVPDLSALATKADMDARFAAFEDRLGRMIAERTDAQTKWIAAIAASTIIILLSSSAFLWPPTRYAAPPPPAPAVGTSQH